MGTTISDSPKPQTASDVSTQTVSEASNEPAAATSDQTPTPQQDPQVAANNAKASKQYASEGKSEREMMGQLLQKSLASQVPSAAPKQILDANKHFAPSTPAPKQLLTADEHFAPNNPVLLSGSISTNTASPQTNGGGSQQIGQNNQAKPFVSPFVKLQSAKPGSESAVNKKMLDEAAKVLRNVRPGQEGMVIETLARTKKAVEANGGNFFPFIAGNMEAIDGVLGSFGFRPMEAPDTVNLQLENFDRAVDRFRAMSPGDREAVRHPIPNVHGAGIVGTIATEEAPSRKEQIAAQQRDPNKILTKLPDGKLYSGYKRDLKDAEETARNRMILDKLENLKSSGPLSLAGRLVGSAADGILGTENLGEGLAAVGSLGDSILPRVASSSAKGRSNAGGPTPPITSDKGKPPVANSSPPPTRGVRAEEQPRAAGDPWSGRASVESNNSSRNSNIGHASTPLADPNSTPPADSPNVAGGAQQNRPTQEYLRLPPGADPNKVISINTSKGPQQITLREYAREWVKADKWVKTEARRLASLDDQKEPTKAHTPASYWTQLSKQAETMFRLPQHWQGLPKDPLNMK